MMGIFRKMVDLRHHEIEHTNGFVKGCRPLRGLDPYAISILGLTPQALCRRPLRGLVSQLCIYRFNGFAGCSKPLKRLIDSVGGVPVTTQLKLGVNGNELRTAFRQSATATSINRLMRARSMASFSSSIRR